MRIQIPQGNTLAKEMSIWQNTHILKKIKEKWVFGDNGPGHAKMCLMPFANNRSADRLISTFDVRCLDSVLCTLAISKASRFQLASVAEQAGLNLTWSKIPEDTFSRDVAQMMLSP